jgi:hypothetical protein
MCDLKINDLKDIMENYAIYTIISFQPQQFDAKEKITNVVVEFTIFSS